MTSPADVSHRLLEELSVQECQELLTTKQVGRVAYADDDGPVVLPVRYVVHEGAVLFHTSPHGSLGRQLRARPAAFEVDEIRDETSSGWSVLVRGRATFVAGNEFPDTDQRPHRWPEGLQSLCVRITPQFITGRRLLAGNAACLDPASGRSWA